MGSLKRRRERLVGEGNEQRFVVERALPDDARLYRKDHSEDDWRELCEDAGEDPARAESLDAPPGLTVPGGVSPDPPEPLARLIGIYPLVGFGWSPCCGCSTPNPEALIAISCKLTSKASAASAPARPYGDPKCGRLIRGGELGHDVSDPGPEPCEEAAAWVRGWGAQGASG